MLAALVELEYGGVKGARFGKRPLQRLEIIACYLWDDDAVFFALEFLGLRELAAQEFDVAA